MVIGHYVTNAIFELASHAIRLLRARSELYTWSEFTTSILLALLAARAWKARRKVDFLLNWFHYRRARVLIWLAYYVRVGTIFARLHTLRVYHWCAIFVFKANLRRAHCCLAWIIYHCIRLYRKAKFNSACLIYYCKRINWTLNRIPAVAQKLSLLPLVAMCGLLNQGSSLEPDELPTLTALRTHLTNSISYSHIAAAKVRTAKPLSRQPRRQLTSATARATQPPFCRQRRQLIAAATARTIQPVSRQPRRQLTVTATARTAQPTHSLSSPVNSPSPLGSYLPCHIEPRGQRDTSNRGMNDTDLRGPLAPSLLRTDHKPDIHVHLRPVFGPPTPPGFVRVHLRHQRCLHCTPRHHPQRYLGKPAGLTVHFRSTLAHLLETRLNPRASPFVFPASGRRNRWHYVTDPVTKHLRLPAPYNTCALQQTRSASKSARRSFNSTQKNTPTNSRPRKVISNSRALPSEPLAAQITVLRAAPSFELRAAPRSELRAAHKSFIAYSRQKIKDKSTRAPRSVQGRHRRHRRHRKNRVRGLPTPASSLYPRQKPPPVVDPA